MSLEELQSKTPYQRVNELHTSFNARTGMAKDYDHDYHMKKAKLSTIIAVKAIIDAVAMTPNVDDATVAYWYEALGEAEEFDYMQIPTVLD